MAKVAFSKLKCKINDTENPIQFNEETIMVKTYLPIQEKLGLIGRVIEQAHEQDYNHSNPVKVSVYRDLEIIFAYTNLTFTDKQKEDLPKLYDQLKSSGVLKIIIENIPKEEYEQLNQGIFDSIDGYYCYRNSIVGIMDNLKDNFNDTSMNVNNLQNSLDNLKDSPFFGRVVDFFQSEYGLE